MLKIDSYIFFLKKIHPEEISNIWAFLIVEEMDFSYFLLKKKFFLYFWKGNFSVLKVRNFRRGSSELRKNFWNSESFCKKICYIFWAVDLSSPKFKKLQYISVKKISVGKSNVPIFKNFLIFCFYFLFLNKCVIFCYCF